MKLNNILFACLFLVHTFFWVLDPDDFREKRKRRKLTIVLSHLGRCYSWEALLTTLVLQGAEAMGMV